jgi:hypothetical protein
MDAGGILDEILSLLESGGVAIRRAAMGGEGSGLCKLRGKDVFFLDVEEPLAEAAAKAAGAVSRSIDIERVYLKPEVRDFIEVAGSQ